MRPTGHFWTWKPAKRRCSSRLYTVDNDDTANLFAAIMPPEALPWFPPSVRDIRAFKVEQWSDFTTIIQAKP